MSAKTITVNANSITSSKDLTINSDYSYCPPLYSACCTISDGWNLAFKKYYYKCEYCGTLHETKFGVCDRCGAPLSNAMEV